MRCRPRPRGAIYSLASTRMTGRSTPNSPSADPNRCSTQLLDAVGRYTHRVAVSNERILGMNAHTVRLRVRDWAHGTRKRTLHVPAQSFIERFFLHVLPKGFKRIRHYGLLGPAAMAV